MCFDGFVANDAKPELATNPTWRGIMVRARKTHGMTQGDLGKAVGLSQVMISKIETGESGGSSEILAICQALSIQAPQHYADEWQQKWAELGQVLRQHNPGQAEAALALVKSMADNEEARAVRSEEVEPASDRRK